MNSTPQGKSGQSHALLGVAPVGSGHVVVYGDSNCLDSSHMTSNCYDFLNKILERVTQVGG
jgi:membrane-bound transcription factor site-1 protease